MDSRENDDAFGRSQNVFIVAALVLTHSSHEPVVEAALDAVPGRVWREDGDASLDSSEHQTLLPVLCSRRLIGKSGGVIGDNELAAQGLGLVHHRRGQVIGQQDRADPPGLAGLHQQTHVIPGLRQRQRSEPLQNLQHRRQIHVSREKGLMGRQTTLLLQERMEKSSRKLPASEKHLHQKR